MKKVIAIIAALICFCAISNSATAQAQADKTFTIGTQTIKVDSILVFKDADIFVYAKIANGRVVYSSKDAQTGDPMPITVNTVARTTGTKPIVMDPIKCVSKCIKRDTKGNCTKYSTTCN
jgi:hypothetical protein